MADVRVTYGRRSRQEHTDVGIQVNTFGLDRLIEGFTGRDLEEIATDALQLPYEQARRDWPVLTGASQSTIRVETIDVGERTARVALQVGGDDLINHPDNPSHKDYAPYIEFNGSPTGRGQGAIRNAIYDHDQDIRNRIHEGVRNKIEELIK